MTHAHGGPPRRGADEVAELPIDPDVDAAVDARHRHGASPFEHGRRARWPRIRPDVVGVVFLGGCIGGYARYGVTDLWPAPADRFPWSTLAVNTVGAFILTLVIVIASDVMPSRYLRPLLGTGFCGALTTFSSVVVSTDELFAHQAQGTAAAYLVASLVAALAAGWLGLAAGRLVAVNRRRTRTRRSSS